MKLLRKSNPVLIEWLNSPIIYQENSTFVGKLKQIIPTFYSPRSCFYHYSHMANGNYREFLQGESVKIKKYFYVLRPVLAMQWIEQNSGVVPMEFDILVNELVEDSQLKEAIQKLLEDKSKGFESKYSPKIEIISDFIESELIRFEDKAQKQSKVESDFSILNPFFIKVLDGDYL